MSGKTGLLIQGPLISKGLSGRSFAIHAHADTEHYVEYDCREDLARLMREARAHVDEVCFVTWKGEESDAFEVEGVEIIRLQDVGANWRKQAAAGIVEDNTLRVLISTLTGIEALKAKGCDRIVKSRSDLILDIGWLAAKTRELCPVGEPAPIIIPWFTPGGAIGDHFMAGTTQAMEELYHFMADIGGAKIGKNIHSTFAFAAGYVNRARALPDVPKRAFFPDAFRARWMNEDHARILRCCWEELFVPCSLEETRHMVWRGEPFSGEAIEGIRKTLFPMSDDMRERLEMEIAPIVSHPTWRAKANVRYDILASLHKDPAWAAPLMRQSGRIYRKLLHSL